MNYFSDKALNKYKSQRNIPKSQTKILKYKQKANIIKSNIIIEN